MHILICSRRASYTFDFVPLTSLLLENFRRLINKVKCKQTYVKDKWNLLPEEICTV